MEKINIGNNVFVCPMAVVPGGTRVERRVNFMTVGWVNRVNAKPPILIEKFS
jgi:flavin reductase (DIM6/NTAB) family NADH-FMN oxidoreductase RutF